MQNKPNSLLRRLGVFGFDHTEPLILAALASEDPILLIGKCGTGKTFLLNSISEALGLQHRHYNASLISFDDLIGFPFPDEDKSSIRFLPTPATIWDAESVLIDELSRCKPEIQNKFFSIVHEKKVQGISLNKLRFRWAAMNPFSFSGDGGGDHYEGSQPLDPALADRFAFVIEVADWVDLSVHDQQSITDPAGEGTISVDGGALKEKIIQLRQAFLHALKQPMPDVIEYCRLVSSFLTDAGLRISPRRARLLARNITALLCTQDAGNIQPGSPERMQLFKMAWQSSLPQRAWQENVPAHAIDSAHAEAVRLVSGTNAKFRWISEWLLLSSQSEKLSRLLDKHIDIDTKSLAVIQMLGRESKSRCAVFALACFPLLSSRNVLNEEALNTLGALAKEVMVIDGEMSWRNNRSVSNTHPEYSRCLQVLNKFPEESRRRKRAYQIFSYHLVHQLQVPDPFFLEDQLNILFTKAAAYNATQP